MQRRTAASETAEAKGSKQEANSARRTASSSHQRAVPYNKLKRIHEPVDSLLTTSSGFTNFRGLYNLGLILLVVSNLRVALENIIKYGILINPLDWFSAFTHEPTRWPCATLVLLVSHCFILTSLFTEQLLARSRISELTGFAIHVFNGLMTLIIPGVVVYYLHPNPIFSCVTLTIFSALVLKNWSYVDCNKWERMLLRDKSQTTNGLRNNAATHQSINEVGQQSGRKHEQDTKKTDEEDNQTVLKAQPIPQGNVLSESSTSSFSSFFKNEAYALEQNLVPVVYPDNVTLIDMYYFIAAPTLCYELNFPRTVKIRKRFLIKRLIEVVCGVQLLFGLVQQWCMPLIRNSYVPMQQLDWPQLLERMLKLAIPNHVLWLLWFYLFFHSFLNVTAELVRFADRAFYKDWWNSENVMEFWSNWNLPVHRFAHRHLYKPLLSTGHSRMMASVIVFLVSAFFHEYVVSVPLQMFRIWAFLGMLVQVPVACMSAKYIRGPAGNFLVWFSLILGQPLIELFYVHDYCILRVWNVTQAQAPVSLG